MRRSISISFDEITLRLSVHLPDVAEKAGLQRAVTQDNAFHGLETAGHILAQLLLRIARHIGYLPQTFKQLVCFAFYHRVEDVAFTFKIGIDGATPFVGCRCNIVHRGILNAFAGKELTGHFYEFLACLTYHDE